MERVIEVGVGTSPTLANLTKAAVEADGYGAQVLHIEIDPVYAAARG